MRLGVSLTATTPTGFFSQRFWSFISQHWNPGLLGLSCSAAVPPHLSARECGTAWSTSHHLATNPLCLSCPSLSLLPVWMNVSYLTPRLSEFFTVWCFGSCGCFLFLIFFFCPSFVVRGCKVYLPTPPSWLESVPFNTRLMWRKSE